MISDSKRDVDRDLKRRRPPRAAAGALAVGRSSPWRRLAALCHLRSRQVLSLDSDLSFLEEASLSVTLREALSGHSDGWWKRLGSC